MAATLQDVELQGATACARHVNTIRSLHGDVVAVAAFRGYARHLSLVLADMLGPADAYEFMARLVDEIVSINAATIIGFNAVRDEMNKGNAA